MAGNGVEVPTWEEVHLTSEYQDDYKVIYSVITGSISPAAFAANDAFIKLIALLITTQRYYVRHIQDFKDLDRTPFFEQLANEIGYDLPILQDYSAVELLRENKRYYGSKVTAKLFTFLGSLIHSPLELIYPSKLIMKYDDPTVVWDGVITDTPNAIDFGKSKIGTYQDGVFFWPFVYIIVVTQAQNVVDYNDMYAILDNINPAGMLQVVWLVANYISIPNPPSDMILFFATDKVDSFIDVCDFPTYDNGFAYAATIPNFLETATITAESIGNYTITIDCPTIVGTPVSLEYIDSIGSHTATQVAASIVALSGWGALGAYGITAVNVGGVITISYPTVLGIATSMTFTQATTGAGNSITLTAPSIPDPFIGSLWDGTCDNPEWSGINFIEIPPIQEDSDYLRLSGSGSFIDKSAVCNQNIVYASEATEQLLYVNAIPNVFNGTQVLLYKNGVDFTVNLPTGVLTWVTTPTINDNIYITFPWVSFSRDVQTPQSNTGSSWNTLYSDTDAIVLENVSTNMSFANITYAALANLTYRQLQDVAYNKDQQNMRGLWLQNQVFDGAVT